MKYENAYEVLPEALLKEIQKYVSGKLLYVPAGEEKRAWGETSGYRDELQKRNRMIRNKYAHGITVTELADEYFLSLDSIKKIIYSKKNGSNLTYSPSIASAVQYANAGLFEEWIQCYLLLTRKDASSADDHMKDRHLYFGVIKFPLRLIQRDGVELEQKVVDKVDGQDDASPPLLVQYAEGNFIALYRKGY